MGSTFTLFLPDVYASRRSSIPAVREEGVGTFLAVRDTAPPPTSSSGSLSGKKVLVADDDMRNLFAVTTILEDEGMVVVHAENGVEAIRALREHENVDLVLMDVMMPEMDGYEAMEEIRKNARWRETPIIALTAKAMKGERARCLEAGATDYLPKPVDSERLLATIARHLLPPATEPADDRPPAS
jgi:CheY-like chemotaxis protein